MRPDALEAACRAHAIRLIYLNPTLQNPTTHTMPEHRRRDIAQVAAQCGARIIEDDPYWLLTPTHRPRWPHSRRRRRFISRPCRNA
jgi:DNA-binding transcriptional MocR family regulator